MPYLGNFVGGVGGGSSESSFSLLSIDDGSESAPSIAYKDDPNLGIYSPAQDTLGFVTNGSEALRIDSNGRVGIGTDNPASLIDIYGEGEDTTQISLRQWNDNSGNGIDGPDIRFFASGGTIASPAEMDDDDVIGKVNAFAYNGTSSVQYGGFGWRYQTDGLGSRGSSFEIETKSINESTNSAKIYISEEGAVGIGTASPISVNLQINGFYNSGTSEYGAPTQYFYTNLSSVSAGTNIGRIIFARNGDSATIAAKSTGTANETDLYFYTRESSLNADPTLKLYHDKTAEFADDVTVSGSVTQQSSSAVQPLINSTGAQSDLFFRCGNNSYSTIVFGDQTNTIRKGIRYDSATDKLEFKGANMSSTHLTVDSSGNVGIGETSPSYKLHVSGDIKLAATGTIWFDDTSQTVEKIVATGSTIDLYADAEVRFFESDASTEMVSVDVNNARIFFNGDDNTYWHRPAADTHAFVNNASTSLYINSDGEVGIKTTSPLQKLNVYNSTPSNTGGILVQNVTYGNNQDKPYLTVGTTNWDGATTNWNTFGIQHRIKSDSSGTARITVDSSNGELFCIENGGNVGIGTNSPSKKLNVNGGSLLVDGGTVSTDSSYAGRFNLTVDNVNADTVFGIRTVTTMNDTGTTNSDREQGAIYNLITDNSIGATDHEHRLYTVWNDVNLYGHADLLYGTYNDINCYSPSSVPSFAHLRGTYNLVQVRQNTTDNTNAQYTNIWGSYNIVQPTGSFNGTIGTIGGVFGRANFGSTATTSVSNVYGVLAEIDNDAGGTTTVTGRSALFYGHYVRTGETQFGYLNDPYGILIEDDVRSYHRGAFGIGPSSREPAAELHVSGDAATIRLHDTDTALSDNERSSGIQFYQSDASGAGISSAIYAEGSGSTGSQSLNFYTGSAGHTIYNPANLHGFSVGDTYTDSTNIDYEVIRVVDDYTFIVEDGSGTPQDYGFVTTVTTNLQHRVIVDSNGRVGIGEQSPATELEVSGTITISNGAEQNALRTNSAGQLEFLSNAASNNTVSMTIDDETQRVHVGPIDDGLGEFNVYTGTSSNNSGIELQVDTIGGNDIVSYNRGSNAYKDLGIKSSTLTLVASSGSAYLRTDTNGNIGIGTNYGETLTQKVKIVGNLDMNGGVLTSQLTAVINDDAYLDVTMPIKGGLIAITSFTTYDVYPQPAGSGIVYFDSGTSRFCTIMSSANTTANGYLVASTSTSTTVTDFTDNRTTISAVNTTGKIRIINRSGSSRQYKITLL